MKKGRILTVLILTLLFWSVGVSEAAPMGTGFTYQGHLYDSNYAATGLYDFAFKLYDANTGGSKVGIDINVADVDVIDAYFTVELDFGSEVFDGNAVWLEMGVRPGDMNDPNGYTTLSPRQEVTPTPYALQTRGLFVDDAGKVGIGTTSPSKKLDVVGQINAIDYYYLNDNVLVYNTPGTGNFFYGWDTGVTRHNMATNGVVRLSIDGSGRVGIGTTGPRGTLDVDAEGENIYLDTWTAQIYLGDVDGDGDETLFTVDDGAGKFTFENGDVGIRTTNPTEALDVNGTAKAIAFVGDGSGLTNLPATPDSDWTISGNDMYSAVSGDVGIGTTSPDYKLDVAGSVRVTDSLNSSHDLKIATDDGAEVALGYNIIQFDRKLYVYTDSDKYGVYSSNKDISGGDRYSIYGYGEGDTAGSSYAVFGRSMNATGDNYGVYGWATNTSSGTNYGVYGRAGNVGAGDAYAGYFDGNVYAGGNVGIGTESPTRALDVNDVIRLQPRATAPSSPSEGDIYMNSTTHKLMVYDGTTWQACW